MIHPPAWASAAPTKPPIRVWEELDGMPSHQVSRFQPMAAISPEKMTGKVIKSRPTKCAMVLPILNSPMKYRKMKKAAKLKMAAHNTAWKGVSTLVETIVAIEMAASWNPLM